jgi:hypothetical protein
MSRDRLTRLRKYCSSRNHTGPSGQRSFERPVTVVGSSIDQQEINRDNLRLQLRDRVDNSGEVTSRKRITSALLHYGIVYRDNGDDIGWSPRTTGQRSKVCHGGFDAVEKPQMAAFVRVKHGRSPKAADEYRN